MLGPQITDLFEQLLHSAVHLYVPCKYWMLKVFLPSAGNLLLLSLYFLARIAFSENGIILRRDLGMEERFLEPHPNNLAKARHPCSAII